MLSPVDEYVLMTAVDVFLNPTKHSLRNILDRLLSSRRLRESCSPRLARMLCSAQDIERL